ncbi:hypothetical protein NMG60_11009878 [Bertholletia excelsa]
MASTDFSIDGDFKKREEREEGGGGIRASDQINAWPNFLPARLLSVGAAAPRSLQNSPRSSFGSLSSRRGGRRKALKLWHRKQVKGLVALIGLLSCFLVMNWWMLSRIQDSSHGLRYKYLKANSSTLSIREELEKLGKVKKPHKTIYARLLAKAAHALAEGQNKPEPKDLWVEPYILASSWRPCADQRDWEPNGGNNGLF